MNTLPFRLLASDTDFIAQNDQTPHGGTISLDTEFFRQESYYPEPCLIQIKQHGLTWLIDPKSLSPSQLAEVLSQRLQRADTLLLHAGHQDIELLTQLNITPAFERIRDTQIAHAFLSQDLQLSYAGLVLHYLGLSVDKEETLSDWRKRPLSDAQCAYAAADVEHLEAVWQQQQAQLEQRGWLAQYGEECQRLYCASEARDPVVDFRRLKNRHLLRESQLHHAFVLYLWRETLCKAHDLTRNRLLRDEQLVQHVLRHGDEPTPKTPANLRRPSGASAAESAEHYTQALDKAADYSPQALIFHPLDSGQKTQLRQLQTAVRQRAEQLGLSASLLAPRKELELLIRKQPSDFFARGWRANLLGETLRRWR